MGYAMMDSFDTIEEANAEKKKMVEAGRWGEERIFIFDDKELQGQLDCKRFTVNIE